MKNIFSRKMVNINGGKKFTGAHLPLPLNSYLSMWTMAMGASKTTIIVDQLERWKSTIQKAVPTQELEKMLAQKALEGFYNLSKKDKRTLPIFIMGLQKELINKGVSANSVVVITKLIRDEAKKGK